MSKENGQEASIFKLTDSGKAARVQQILEKYERANEALTQRDELGNKRVYEEVKSYVQQFEGIANTHDFTDFLKNRPMGAIRKKHILPVIKKTAGQEDITLVNADRYPIRITGAEGFIGINTITIPWEGAGGELTSGSEVSKVDLYLPAEVSENAFRQTLKFQANIGLEIDPGEIDVSETDPV